MRPPGLLEQIDERPQRPAIEVAELVVTTLPHGVGKPGDQRPARRRDRDLDQPPVGDAAPPADEPPALQLVEHPRHVGGAGDEPGAERGGRQRPR